MKIYVTAVEALRKKKKTGLNSIAWQQTASLARFVDQE